MAPIGFGLIVELGRCHGDVRARAWRVSAHLVEVLDDILERWEWDDYGPEWGRDGAWRVSAQCARKLTRASRRSRGIDRRGHATVMPTTLDVFQQAAVMADKLEEITERCARGRARGMRGSAACAR